MSCRQVSTTSATVRARRSTSWTRARAAPSAATTPTGSGCRPVSVSHPLDTFATECRRNVGPSVEPFAATMWCCRRGGGRRALRGELPVGRRGPGAGPHARRGGAAQPRLRLRRRTHARAPRHQVPTATHPACVQPYIPHYLHCLSRFQRQEILSTLLSRISGGGPGLKRSPSYIGESPLISISIKCSCKLLLQHNLSQREWRRRETYRCSVGFSCESSIVGHGAARPEPDPSVHS